jgi:hypothetical protein
VEVVVARVENRRSPFKVEEPRVPSNDTRSETTTSDRHHFYHGLPESPLAVGARLREFSSNWEAVTEDRWTLSVIRRGFKLMFVENPPLAPHPIFSRIPILTANVKEAAVRREVETLLEKRAVIELFPPYTPGFYSSIFVIPKKNSEKLRLVINLKPLNRMLEKYPFKMETTRSITAALHQGDWTVSVDLTDAYFHVAIHSASQKFLRFTNGGRVFQFVALPFGLAPAPFVFTKLMDTVAQTAHKRMLHLFLYLDDSLMRNEIRKKLLDQVPILLDIFDTLGFLRNEAKSDVVTSQRFVFLGILYDLLRALAMIPEERWIKIKSAISAILRREQCPASSWCVALGLLTSVQDLVVLGRLHLRELQIHLNKHWKQRHIMSVMIPMSKNAHRNSSGGYKRRTSCKEYPFSHSTRRSRSSQMHRHRAGERTWEKHSCLEHGPTTNETCTSTCWRC